MVYLNKFLSKFLTNPTYSLKIFWFNWINKFWWKYSPERNYSSTCFIYVKRLMPVSDYGNVSATYTNLDQFPTLNSEISHVTHIMKLQSRSVASLRKRPAHRYYLLHSFRKALVRLMATSSEQNFSFASLHEVILIEQSVKCKKVDEHVER